MTPIDDLLKPIVERLDEHLEYELSGITKLLEAVKIMDGALNIIGDESLKLVLPSHTKSQLAREARQKVREVLGAT